MYLALNGAVHDAAVAAWGAKGYYDSVRPISMIRYMGGLGQSSDPERPCLPSRRPAARGRPRRGHHRASPRRPASATSTSPSTSARSPSGPGRATPRTPRPRQAGVDWIRAVDWVPYQQPTFVTPAFAGYVSGHSTFSRAAAEVLTALTGSPVRPRRPRHVDDPGRAGSKSEQGPTEDVELQWATYYDAADQAGISRLYGGIHIAADDFGGRTMGSQCGKDAWALAQPLLRRDRPDLSSSGAGPDSADRSSAEPGAVASRPWECFGFLRAHLDTVAACLLAAAFLVEVALAAPSLAGEPLLIGPRARREPRSRRRMPVFLLSLALRTRLPLVPLGARLRGPRPGRPRPHGRLLRPCRGPDAGDLLGRRLGRRAQRSARRARRGRPRRPRRRCASSDGVLQPREVALPVVLLVGPWLARPGHAQPARRPRRRARGRRRGLGAASRLA